ASASILNGYCQSRLVAAIPCLSSAPAPPALDPLSLHDALPISQSGGGAQQSVRLPEEQTPETPEQPADQPETPEQPADQPETPRSEEHTSELQSRFDLVCRLLLETKKNRPRQRSHERRAPRAAE